MNRLPFMMLAAFVISCMPRTYILPDAMIDLPAVIRTARSLEGTPYVYGGTMPDGFDCAGFLAFIFEKQGLTLPRTSSRQARVGKKVSRRDLLPGDMVFFHTKGIFPRVTHAGIYTGNGQFLHAASSEPAVVRSDSLDAAYYQRCFLFGRRISVYSLP